MVRRLRAERVEREMTCRLEHVNITVVDMDRAIAFVRIAFPEFRVRGGGTGDFGGSVTRWAHLGVDEVYVSLNACDRIVEPRRKPTELEETGINHVGFVVDGVRDLQRKYEAAEFECQLIDELPSRLRLYVADSDGIIWEFVEYLSDDVAIRNDYSI
jgi:catechol 2,3-dioxygenase-like lactoylglutathione lyase family enzyme